MRYQQLLLLLGLTLISINIQAQKLNSSGKIPSHLKKTSVTLFLEGNSDSRLIPAAFEAFTAAGYEVFIDGERRPTFGGQVATVTVADTTFTRQEQNLMVRSIHKNKPTVLIATIEGATFINGTRFIYINIINRTTGGLLLSIYSKRRNAKFKLDRFSAELLSILASDNG